MLNDKEHQNMVETVASTEVNDTVTPKLAAKVISSPGVSMDGKLTDMVVTENMNIDSDATARVISAPRRTVEGRADVSKASTEWGSMNSDKVNVTQVAPDNLFLHANQFSGIIPDVDTEIYHKWFDQSEFKFGFVPLGDQILPKNFTVNNSKGLNPLETHKIVKATNKPNYMEARLPISSQLNVDTRKSHLQGNWDQQLLQLIEFGFPLDFNTNCPLNHETGNHKSATEFANDIDAYIAEELKYDTLLGPFESHPGQCSPFMSRAKPKFSSRYTRAIMTH